MSEADAISEKARAIHKEMLSQPKQAFSQDDLKVISGIQDDKQLMTTLQTLLDNALVKLLEGKDKQLLFQAVQESEASKIMQMSDDEAMIYSYIEASGREGIWTKVIKAKTNLHQQVIQRCLKTLENQSYIKSIKSVKFPQRKIYMLYGLTPSIEVTGGPWFNGVELDVDFIDSLLIVIWRFVASKTYPKVFNKDGYEGGVHQLSYDAEYLDLQSPSLKDISQFLTDSNITNVELSLGDVKSLCDVLEYEEKLEKFNHTFYKATYQSILESGGAKVADVDVLKPQQGQFFNVNDNYRVIVDNSLGNTDESKPNKDNIYLDAWFNL